MHEEIVNAYRRVFNSPDGKRILQDFERIIFQIRIDANDPNPDAALYQAAQFAFIRRIHNLLKEPQNDR